MKHSHILACAAAALLFAASVWPVEVAGQAPGGAPTDGTHAASSSGSRSSIVGTWRGRGGQALYSLESGWSENQAVVHEAQATGRSIVIDPPDRKIPYQPWALAVRNARRDLAENPGDLPKSKDLDTNTKCYPSGLPVVMYRDAPVITEFPGFLLMQFEFDHQFRVIYTDGRPRMPKSVKLWYGDSHGRWEGDTLVVETTNLNGYPWMSIVGDFYSDNATIVERFTPLGDTMRYQATITDPTVFTRPWTIGWEYARQPSQDILEHACLEGNRIHMWDEIYKRELAPRQR